jgi:hypothetical protein
MRAILLLLLLAAGIGVPAIAQNKIPGQDLKQLIGKRFRDKKELPLLRHWQMREGYLLPSTDSIGYAVQVLQKKQQYLVLLTQLDYSEDERKPDYIIRNLLEIKAVQRGQELMTASCHANGTGDESIIALATPRKDTEVVKRIHKAWRINTATRSIITIPVKGIDCLQLGLE